MLELQDIDDPPRPLNKGGAEGVKQDVVDLVFDPRNLGRADESSPAWGLGILKQV